MPIDFFERELQKIQTRFNQTFGVMPTCDLQARAVTILIIIGLNLLARKINANKLNSDVRLDVRKFLKKKVKLNSWFDYVESQIQKRKENHHVECTLTGKTQPDPETI